MSERFDELTGLITGPFFEDRVSHALLRATRTDRPLAVAVLEVQGLKDIEAEAEEVAAMLVRAIGQRIRGALRKVDTVAHLGDGRFGVLAEDLAETSHAAFVARKVSDALAQPFHVIDRDISPTISSGVAISPFDGESYEALMASAEEAREKVAEAGTGGYALANPDLADP
jgi:diguanylate cyclase (GGDEF)-like protein